MRKEFRRPAFSSLACVDDEKVEKLTSTEQRYAANARERKQRMPPRSLHCLPGMAM